MRLGWIKDCMHGADPTTKLGESRWRDGARRASRSSFGVSWRKQRGSFLSPLAGPRALGRPSSACAAPYPAAAGATGRWHPLEAGTRAEGAARGRLAARSGRTPGRDEADRARLCRLAVLQPALLEAEPCLLWTLPESAMRKGSSAFLGCLAAAALAPFSGQTLAVGREDHPAQMAP